jgi:hyperosmotically inducible protein
MRVFTLFLIAGALTALPFAGCNKIDTSKGPVVDSGRPNSDMPPTNKTTPAPANPNLTPPVTQPGPLTPGTGATGTGAERSSTTTAPGTTADTTPPPGTRPDNTAVNQRDAADLTKAKTPIDQDENQADVKITADIRKRVLDQENFSVYARNAKIITSGGMVTLRGPVNSKTEADTIERIAREVAGEGKVDNQLEVAPSER